MKRLSILTRLVLILANCELSVRKAQAELVLIKQSKVKRFKNRRIFETKLLDNSFTMDDFSFKKRCQCYLFTK